ncbi:hypothetical protein EDD99_6796 [Streptomyces sp. 846.5]|nr:hypothetical protein [Streptomyces sp. 846.5]TDT98568.1 hypothetical protein EDD99_6796 [Streptomyces sp. 846.5]
MNALRDFVRVHVAPALRPHGFRRAGSHLALALPDDDLLIFEFNVHRVDPVRDVFDMTFKYALRTYWRWLTLNEPNPRRMRSTPRSFRWCSAWRVDKPTTPCFPDSPPGPGPTCPQAGDAMICQLLSGLPLENFPGNLQNVNPWAMGRQLVCSSDLVTERHRFGTPADVRIPDFPMRPSGP